MQDRPVGAAENIEAGLLGLNDLDDGQANKFDMK